MSLRQTIQNKDKFIIELLSKFDSQWQQMSTNLQRELVGLFRRGETTAAAIQGLFQEFGFDGLANEVTVQFQQVAKFSKQMAKQTGYNFLITDDNLSLFDDLTGVNLQKMLGTKAQIANDIQKFGIESILEGKSVKDIRLGLDESFKAAGRHLNTEIFTGIQSYGRAIDLTAMKNAGIEKFVYLGPSDGKTRDICQDALNDPRQQTGWTLDEVNNSNTPFVSAGGFNCRHQWVAFV